ncbi:hypothetical protein V1478_017508 [Vespula squamosa]|uniref:Uncharacterized protein n=1 Tax=Vespula squamosa TaxID=30214 RepID=A0ABD1ZXJ7_VESSQ
MEKGLALPRDNASRLGRRCSSSGRSDTHSLNVIAVVNELRGRFESEFPTLRFSRQSIKERLTGRWLNGSVRGWANRNEALTEIRFQSEITALPVKLSHYCDLGHEEEKRKRKRPG